MARITAPGRVTVVTGSARGIGRAIAEAFVAAGDRVVGFDVEEGILKKTASELGCAYEVVDVRNSASVESAVGRVEENSGPIDILVNNAGVMDRHSVVEMPDEAWEKVVGTNLTGVFNCSRAVARRMGSRHRGWIVNIGSIWASHAWPQRAAYAASKAAVEHFTRCFALEMAPWGVRVNAVSPGIMSTEMTAGVVRDDAFRASFLPRVALGEVGDPKQHLAGLVVFLTSPEAGYMSGEIVDVHGGYF